MSEVYNTKNIYPSPEQQAHAELNAFVFNPGLVKLAGLYGVHEVPDDSANRLAVLQKVAADNWDFRKGATRQDTNWDNHLLDDPASQEWQTIFEAADELSMVHDSEPFNKHPEALAILGGANKSIYHRLRYGMEQIDDMEHIVIMGSSRKVSAAERKNAAEFAPNARTEYDLGCGAIETLLGASALQEMVFRPGDWSVRHYEFEHNGITKPAFVIGAPRGNSTRDQANTYDGYDMFADQAQLGINPNDRVVAVTTALYVPSQHLRAVQGLTLFYGTPIETIGHSAEYSGVDRKPSQLLQETKAAIDAAVRLQDTLAA